MSSSPRLHARFETSGLRVQRRTGGRTAAALAVAVLSVGAAQLLIAASPANAIPAPCTPSTGFNSCRLFTGTDDDQSFIVPKGVVSVRADLKGSGGYSSVFNGPGFGGSGGATTGTIAVTGGEHLGVAVGTSTYGGGGAAGVGTRATGGHGGGLSGLWVGGTFGENPLLIAGGGGGASGAGASGALGGAGGGLSGGDGSSGSLEPNGGYGGTQLNGGGHGLDGTSGAAYQGGAGGAGYDSGGGGGGGYFGGGGGGDQTYFNGQNNDGGGGGGSSFIDGSGVTDASTTAGGGADTDDNGQVQLQWCAPAPVITSPANSSTTTDTTPTVTGTAVPGTQLTLTADDAAVTCAEGSPLVVPDTGAWSCTPTTASDLGPVTFVASQSDPASPSFAYPASAAVTITIAAPTAPTSPTAPTLIVTSPTSGTVIAAGKANPAIRGSGAVAGDTIRITEAAATICVTTVQSGGTWSCTPAAAFMAGTHRLTISEYDGDALVASRTLTLTKQAAPASSAAASQAAAAANPLANTGSQTATLSALAACLLLGGVGLLLVTRRRRQH